MVCPLCINKPDPSDWCDDCRDGAARGVLRQGQKPPLVVYYVAWGKTHHVDVTRPYATVGAAMLARPEWWAPAATKEHNERMGVWASDMTNDIMYSVLSFIDLEAIRARLPKATFRRIAT